MNIENTQDIQSIATDIKKMLAEMKLDANQEVLFSRIAQKIEYAATIRGALLVEGALNTAYDFTNKHLNENADELTAVENGVVSLVKSVAGSLIAGVKSDINVEFND